MIDQVRQTLQEMLVDRNYHCCQLQPNESEYKISYDEDSCTKYVRIFIVEETKVGIKQLKEMLQRATDVNHIIIVYANDITTFAKQSLEEYKDIRFELFSFAELAFNVSKHELVPKHMIYTKHLKDVCQTFHVKKHNLPKIMMHDPVIKYIGAQKGDLVKIFRENTVYYRMVV